MGAHTDVADLTGAYQVLIVGDAGRQHLLLDHVRRRGSRQTRLDGAKTLGDLLELEHRVAGLLLGDDVGGCCDAGVEQVGLNLVRDRGLALHAVDREVIPARKQRSGGLWRQCACLLEELLRIIRNSSGGHQRPVPALQYLAQRAGVSGPVQPMGDRMFATIQRS